MLEVSCAKSLASESYELAFQGKPGAGYLSHVVCKLLHRSGVFTCIPLV